MPIRFRCAYCSQLMGIARRKAGTVVRCPKCAGQVVVPVPESGRPHGGANGAGQVFEQSDFDRFFQQEANPGQPAPPAPAPMQQQAPVFPVNPSAEPGFDVEPVQPYAIGPGIFLSPGKLAILGAAVVILMGASFLLGLFLGRA
jgi:hypothetical protein